MSLKQFYRSVRHVPPIQLWSRLWLTVRRKFTMSSLGSSVRSRRNEPLPVADELPTAVFPPRRHLVVERDGQPFLFQLNRYYPLGGVIDWQLENEEQSTHLERLAFHYLEFLESIDVGLGESIVLDWIDKNPPWQPGYWLDTWNSYAVSIRSVCMMQWLAQHRETLSRATFDKVAGSITEQIRFLYRNLEVDIRGNHLMKNIKAMLWAGRFFTGREAKLWASRGEALLFRELSNQFLSDGLHFELSPAYHCQVVADVLDCVPVVSPGLGLCLLATIEPNIIDCLTHPDGQVSLFNDAGLDMAYQPDECLRVHAACLSSLEPQQDDVARLRHGLLASVDVAEMAAIAQSDKLQNLRRGECELPPSALELKSGSFGLSDAGFYGVRYPNTYLLFDCGPSCADALPAHGHGDILAFEWDVNEHRIVVDAGVKEYETGPERVWNRSTRAHNTVTVGDRDQCEFLKSFRVGHRSHGQCVEANLDPDSFSVIGCYTSRHADGQEVRHTRMIAASPDSVEVDDDVKSKLNEPAVARLLFNHECQLVSETANRVRVTLGQVTVAVESESEIRIVASKWSPNFGTSFETSQLEIHYGETPCEGGFTLKVVNGI